MEWFEDAICLLKEWQPLAGAFLGGMFSLMVALLVARHAARRAQIHAAMVTLSALTKFRGSFEGVADQKKNPEEHLVIKYAIFSALHPSTVSSSAIPYMQLLYTVNTHLAAHLDLIIIFSGDIELAQKRCELDSVTFNKEGKSLRTEQEFKGDAKLIYDGSKTIVNHIGCAIQMIERLVLPSWPVRSLNALRIRFAPDDITKLCSDALKKGTFETPFPARTPSSVKA